MGRKKPNYLGKKIELSKYGVLGVYWDGSILKLWEGFNAPYCQPNQAKSEAKKRSEGIIKHTPGLEEVVVCRLDITEVKRYKVAKREKGAK